jgi:NDP-sugar pyrophosphorylase family protein
MRAIIFAGGKGTRLAPYTTIFPKPMLPLGDRPILEVVIKQLANYGFTHITLSVGYMAELIQAYFHDKSHLPDGIKLDYVNESKPLGTAGALSLMERPEESCLVLNGDVLTTLNYRNFFDFHLENQGMVTIAMHKREVKIDFGVLTSNDNDEVISYTEKPALDYQVSMGVYVFRPENWDYLVKNEYLDFPDLVLKLLKEGKKVQGFPTSEFWLDIGRHDDYEEAVSHFKEMEDKLLTPQK